MSWDGLEIDMLSLGDADSILITRWNGSVPMRVLVDGGNKKSAGVIRQFLRARRVEYIDHVVCSHPHDDHANGLIELVLDESLKFGTGWMHIPQNHLDMPLIAKAVRNARHVKAAQVVEASVNTCVSLYEAFERRGVTVNEPFEGTTIGFLTVCGPTVEFYEEILAELADAGKLQQLSESWAREDLSEDLMEAWGLRTKTAAAPTGLLDNPETDPLNNSSTILAAVYDGKTFLFTADAGVPALTAVAQAYRVANLRWMQIPHHGSRRNITKSLIEHFSPTTAFVSAEGNRKHPRKAVVNAFKEQGTKVYSTHFPQGGHLWHHSGTVPPRSGYSTAVPLWEDNE